MSIAKFDKKGFIEAVEPGLVSFIVQQFQDRLEEKINEAVNETYDELKKELPDQVKAKIESAMLYDQDMRSIRVEVDFRDNRKNE